MLPEIKLDDEMYEDIVEQMRNRIAFHSPEWTDHNAHDPGITFLELFAWLKEAQQYYMDHLDREMYPKFLKLLGLKCRDRRPAEGWLAVGSDRAVLLPGTPFYADRICLTLQEQAWCSGAVISSMKASNGTICNGNVIGSGQMHFYPFSKIPVSSTCWTIDFEKPVSGVPVFTMYVGVSEDYPVKRNPVQKNYPQLASWETEVLTDGTWVKCDVISDDTAVLTTSGRIRLSFPEGAQVSAVRFRLTETHYDVPPLLTKIRPDVFAVSQLQYIVCSMRIKSDKKPVRKFLVELNYPSANWETEYFMKDETGYTSVKPVSVEKTDRGIEVELENPAEELMSVCTSPDTGNIFLRGECDGFPEQVFDLRCEMLCCGHFEIMIYDSYDKHWHIWHRTDSLAESGHLDRVYQLDEIKGVISFGDGIHGRMPDGEFRIISIAVTEAENGNIKDGNITGSPVSEKIRKNAVYRSVKGGAEGETPEMCLRRSRMEQKLPARAVTREDYEQLVRSAPGLMIKGCRISSGEAGENRVSIAIEPYTGSEKAKPNPVYLDIIRQFLEPRRLVGTQISVSFPVYADIRIYAELVVRSHDMGTEKKIRSAVRELFSNDYHVFGKTILYSAVYAVFDSMPDVRHIQALVMQCRSDHVTITSNGDLMLPENGLTYLSSLELKLISSI